MSERHTLRLAVIYDCPNMGLIAEYHLSDGRIFFCDFLRSHWFKDFNTAKATKVYIQPHKETPDLIWDGEKLVVVEKKGEISV